jgi:hypothetical protein
MTRTPTPPGAEAKDAARDCFYVSRYHTVSGVPRLDCDITADCAKVIQRAISAATAAQAQRIEMLEKALTAAFEMIDRANHLLEASDAMRNVHDGKSDYLWSNLSNAANHYRATTLRSGNMGEEAKVRAALRGEEERK